MRVAVLAVAVVLASLYTRAAGAPLALVRTIDLPRVDVASITWRSMLRLNACTVRPSATTPLKWSIPGRERT